LLAGGQKKPLGTGLQRKILCAGPPAALKSANLNTGCTFFSEVKDYAFFNHHVPTNLRGQLDFGQAGRGEAGGKKGGSKRGRRAPPKKTKKE